MSEPDGDELYETIVALMDMEGMEDMSEYFLPRHLPWTRYVRMWSMIHRGQEVRSHTDYILGMDLHMFQKFAV